MCVCVCVYVYQKPARLEVGGEKRLVGHNHTSTVYIRCSFGREITKYTVIYGAHIRFWPTLEKHLALSSIVKTSKKKGGEGQASMY